MNNAQIELIQPMPVERCKDGFWSHPGFPDFDENYSASREWMDAQGLTHSQTFLESEDESHPAYHAYYEEECAGVVSWNPEPPAGDGWFTLSIHDTEDGPVWVWVRRIAAAKEPS
jgi:hypothetical protein